MKQHFFHADFCSKVAIVIITILSIGRLQAIDIAPMTWTPRADWINVKTDPRVIPHAAGDGMTDDTAAIQSALNILNNNAYNQQDKTVYFPTGIYKITSTLKTTVSGYNIIGCGLNTIIKWYGASGDAMFWPDGSDSVRYLGLVWDGNGLASCAYEEYSDVGTGGGSTTMTAIRHENESFRNFIVNGTYPAPDPKGAYPNGFPPSAIIAGFGNSVYTAPVSEVTILNCCFNNAGYAIYVPVEQVQNLMWLIDGCEFDNNTIAFSGGGNASGGADFILMNSHFQGSTVADIGYDGAIRAQRLTSFGSAMFANTAIDGASFRDCWVDGWTNPFAAIEFIAGGQGSVVDCAFTHPPLGASAPIYTHVNTGGQLIDLLLSNNNATGFPSGLGIVNNTGVTPIIDVVPPGSMNGNLTSATQTFLRSATVNDGPHILDVTKSPYNAVPGWNGTTSMFTMDSTSAIQTAITAAATANNNWIVYLPGGFYEISSTLNLPAGKYTVEGEGVDTQLCWTAGSNGTMMTVTNPTTIAVRQLELSAAWNATGTSDYNSNYPISDNTTITGLKETSTSGTSIATYDNVIVNTFNYSNIGATGNNTYSPGLVLSGLPATATVYIPVMNSPLTVVDCGQAKIYSKMAYMGLVNVSGATHPKTGFLGFGVLEGGQNYGWSGGPNNGLANITVNDNQNLLVGAYYTEEEGNDLSLLRGAGTTTGQVAIEGMNAFATATPSSTAVNVNNYAGRFFYGTSFLENDYGVAVQVQQTGSNPIDMMFTNDFFDGSTEPAFNGVPFSQFISGSGANLIATLNQNGVAGTSANPMLDTPSPLTTANYTSLASSMDDFRQLGALNLAVEFGPTNPSMINPSGLVAYWKLDETANPSADSSMSGITGTWKNSPTSSTTTPGSIPYADPGCITLNGTNQYISMGNPAGLPSGTTGKRTICGWAKSTTTAAGLRVIASFGTATTGEAMYIGMNGTSIVGGAFNSDLTVTNFWDTSWHFIALTYDGTTANLYADGVLKASSAKSWNLVHSACNIGAFVNATDFWKGQVDDVRIYNYALSATQVSNLIATASGQVINVQFSDGQGGTNPSEILNGDAWSPSISPLAYTGTTWSQGFAGSGTNLPYSDGTPSTIGYALSGALNISNNGVSPLELLTEVFYASSGNMTLTITGLQNNQTYDLYFPSAFNGDGSNVTIGTQTLSTTGVASGSSFVSGVNYVEFTGITPVSNSIVVTIAPNGTGLNLGLLNGFQLTAH